jgi:hypothetical protein
MFTLRKSVIRSGILHASGAVRPNCIALPRIQKLQLSTEHLSKTGSLKPFLFTAGITCATTATLAVWKFAEEKVNLINTLVLYKLLTNEESAETRRRNQAHLVYLKKKLPPGTKISDEVVIKVPKEFLDNATMRLKAVPPQNSAELRAWAQQEVDLG